MNKQYFFQSIVQERMADLLTPVGIYLQLRDRFANVLLLESSDYSSREDSFSFICADALATIQVQNFLLQTNILGEEEEPIAVAQQRLPNLLLDFSKQFHFSQELPYNGLYGHSNFDAVQYFDSPVMDVEKRTLDIPDLRYSLFRFIIVIHHYSNKLFLVENIPAGASSQIDRIETALKQPIQDGFAFSRVGTEESPLLDEEFRQMVEKAKEHCARGDVFQLVLSRRFSQAFSGDEFNVYRALRVINPSPYLFYFDYGTYKLFGSSPEAQLLIKNHKAMLMPIAGTYRRSGDSQKDLELAQQLLADPKETAEHVMLVDLARNDLNRHCDNVQVNSYKEVHYYSHVIHLVSKVDGDLTQEANPIQVFADSFPAGTLSGAPKYKALELINRYEPHNRSYYGGAIGFFGFNGDINQAILIRSFLSFEQKLHYQAGAGIVMDSEPELELQEVNNKLAALKKALMMAEGSTINN